MKPKESLNLIVGLGKTGLSIARYLQWRNKPFILFDTRNAPPELDVFCREFPSVPYYLEALPEAVLATISTVISSPGVSLDTPVLKKAHALRIPIIGDIELLAREIDAPVIAITGTNGKSTVTSLVGEMAKAAGYNVAVAGNIGTPVLDLLREARHYELWVLELSSFQLDLVYSLSPAVATVLNMSEDHLDRHHTFAAYKASKHRIYTRAKAVVYNRDDADTIPQGLPATTVQSSFGSGPPQEGDWGIAKDGDGRAYLARGKQRVSFVSDLSMRETHNCLNALAACALVEQLGFSEEAMARTLSSYVSLAHRSQWVRTLNQVDWINDSKGTNVGAASAAICGLGERIAGKVVLIAGGQGKDADFYPLKKPLQQFVRSLILMGEDAQKIDKAVVHQDTHHVDSLAEAVALAQTKARAGDAVLLSPACASFDMFQDFAARGDAFIRLVDAL